ncbi:hypothetical protein HDU98_006938 [Podochytrium sp. JEL0797]|nr:hypothetical protein HDU98_006938 [Podochytrium sp. JEL0797]
MISRFTPRRAIQTTTAIATAVGAGVGMGYYYLSYRPTNAPTTCANLSRGMSVSAGPFTITRSHDSVAANEDKSHHLADGKGFVNPWDSFREASSSFLGTGFKLLMEKWSAKTPPQHLDTPKIPLVRPVDFDALSNVSNDGMALTWLGHAAFLLTLPGATILLDPCLSDRCSPLSFAGPKRVVELPPNLNLDTLKVDAVIVSHNHYDHLDLPVLQRLHATNNDIVFFVPLGNKQLLVDAGIQNVMECDWWDAFSLSKPKTADSPAATFEITCTPCQHFSSRSAFDRNQTLWSSWLVTTPAKRFFFGGDTGYRTVLEGEDATESTLPTCPAFRDVRKRFGPMHLAALPIGAYEPRHLFSGIHCNPNDAIDVHRDLECSKSVAMHWGTFPLGFEPVMDPPRVLKEEMEKRGIPESEFLVLDVGESVDA